MTNYITIFLRSFLSFIALLFLSLLMGKKQLSQLTFFDYTLGITLGSITASISIDKNIPIYNGILGLLVWSILPILLGIINLKNIKFRRTIAETPIILINKGKIIKDNLSQSELNIKDLTMKLREKNAFNISNIEYAILEPDGEISVLLKSNKQPITPSNLNIQTTYTGLPKTIIEDGILLEEKLKNMNISKSWIMHKLSSKKIYKVSDVFVAQVDEAGNMYVDLYEDKNSKLIKDNSNEIILTNLECLHSQFYSYYLETENKEVKNLYIECKSKIENIILNFNNYINEKKTK